MILEDAATVGMLAFHKQEVDEGPKSALSMRDSIPACLQKSSLPNMAETTCTIVITVQQLTKFNSEQMVLLLAVAHIFHENSFLCPSVT